MEQTKALNALEPYLALTKSATAPRAAADLVTQATSNPNTYVFAELLQAPQIQALSQSPDHAAYLQLLEIFSYGTFAAYRAQAAAGTLPALNDAQTLKLRQLSLLTLARDPHNLSYAALQHALGLPDARAVEDLVISAIYADLLAAQLDPRHQTVHVSRVSPLRDLAPNSIPAALAALQSWSGRCTSTLADLSAQIAAIRHAAAQRHAEKAGWEAAQAALVDNYKAQEAMAAAGSGGLGGAGGAGGSTHGRAQNRLLENAMSRFRGGGGGAQRSAKRGSNTLDASVDDDEAMDVDEEEPDDGEGANGGGASVGGKKLRSRRKL